MLIVMKYDDILDRIRQFIIVCIVFVSYFYNNFAYRNLLTGDNCTPLTRMNAISVVLKSTRDRAYTQGILIDRVPKDKIAIKHFPCWKLNEAANNIFRSSEDRAKILFLKLSRRTYLLSRRDKNVLIYFG